MPSPPAPPAAAPRLPRVLFVRLAGLMLVQYISLGLWNVTVGTYIGSHTGYAGKGMFDAWFVGLAGVSGALGALVSPVLFGALADGRFCAERLIAVLNLVCAGMLFLLCQTENQWWFFLYLLGYFQCCVPAMSLCNSLAFRHLGEARHSFPVIRAAGTVGWILALVTVGSVVPWLLGVSSKEVESSLWPMGMGVVMHLVTAAYALSLPSTAPLSGVVTWRSLLVGSGRLLHSQPRLVIFLGVSFLATLPAPFFHRFANLYLNELGITAAATKLSMGQMVEIGCMLLLPWLMRQWGPKRVFLVGVVAWWARYLCLAYGGTYGWPLVAVYVAILLHGVCYTFVYVTGHLYVDRASPPETQNVAQGLLTMATIGGGHLAGSLLSGWMQAYFLTPAGIEPAPYDWTWFFLVPASFSLLAAVVFLLLMGWQREPGSTRSVVEY